MDHANYHVVYVDARIGADLDGKHLQKSASNPSDKTAGSEDTAWEQANADCLKAIINEVEDVRNNVKRLLRQFNGVHTCICEKSCMANLRRLDSASPVPNPTIVFSGTNLAQNRHPQSVNDTTTFNGPHTGSDTRPESGDLSLLKTVSYEISKGNLSKLVIPVAFVYSADLPSNPASSHLDSHHNSSQVAESATASQTPDNHNNHSLKTLYTSQDVLRFMDCGAADVLESPLQESRLQALIIQAYRCHKEALHERALQIEKKRSRKLSWLGNTENKPYAYLREKMVSDLMTGICHPDQHFHLGTGRSVPALEPEREAYLKQSLGSWSYWGHDFSDDELVHAAVFMLEHALSLPELQYWRASTEKLVSFLMASRAAYNNFVDYHNFKHVIDVMQATFYFLIQLGVLPRYPATATSEAIPEKSALASLLRPIEALTLLITAIGHDVGHPGVNNAFLVALNAPLAQLYNDRSVLEAFHCAAFSQILRRYWRTTFESSDMRSLMINSILATDMGVHQKYMTDLGRLQDKLHHQPDLDGYSAQQLEEFRVLLCALLIKCADISNVARPYRVAVQWANILQLEFANQGVMEEEVGIPSTLFGGPPELHNLIKLGNSQKSFMNFFAQPLFDSVADVLPAMVFTSEELKRNQDVWAERIRIESEKRAASPKHRQSPSGVLSPRSRSPDHANSTPELALAEGLPASNPSGDDLRRMSVPQSRATPTPLEHQSTNGATSSTLPDLGEAQLLAVNEPRRSSHTIALSSPSATADTTTYSRRSSGALSSTSNPNTMLAPRRGNNGSPSQLQLAPDYHNPANLVNVISENKVPSHHVSDGAVLTGVSGSDSLPGTGTQPVSTRIEPAERDPKTEVKVIDTIRANAGSHTHVSSDGPLEPRGHNRSSSGAHTNNTSVSQSSPYSLAGTQATSMMTVDSDNKSAHGRLDSMTDRANGFKPFVVINNNIDNATAVNAKRSISRHPLETQEKPSSHTNGSLWDSFEGGEQHSIRRKKSSKFNFLPWKRRGKTCFEPGH